VADCVRYRRTGGFAGTTLSAEAPFDELPDELQTLLLGTDLNAVAGGGPPQGADRFQHELVVEREDGEQRAVLGDHEVPDELKPLLEWLAAKARAT
jgi:hypothetical protein